jgi:hypothetical protein
MGTTMPAVATTYLADDEDMLGAQTAYAQMEADLQYLLDNFEAINPGYDEYHFFLDEIWHDPYELMSILHALHDGEWILAQVEPTLTMIFDRQYILTITVIVEVRTRIETHTYIDPETEEEYEVDYVIEYNYYICIVELENFNMMKLPIYMMSESRLSRYAMLKWTLGNRPDLFPISQFPHASVYREPSTHVVPESYLSDPVFAAILEEAVKHRGMPYVWGGYSPIVSFDCSGFVSWVLNQSGWNIGRLTATGLYNISTPVSEANARPGDLVFFANAGGISHVGIYVGDNMMIHSGSGGPIDFAPINNPYSFGRP